MSNSNQAQITSVKIGAEAGQGVKSAGLLLAKLATRSGYHIYNSVEFPSLIRGGHNSVQINFSREEVTAPKAVTDLLVALNRDTVVKHCSELASGSGVLYDSTKNVDTSAIPAGVNLFDIPFSTLADPMSGNTVALGAVVALFGGSIQILKELITEEFSAKGEQVVNANILAAESGFKYISDKYGNFVKQDLQPLTELSTSVPTIVIDGTEAVAMGAISAGLQYASIYPMSPISNILHLLAQNQAKFGYLVMQPEDEISAINMAIGASYAGARSMTATSGGGFCLMTEGYGLAGMTETPLVIIEGMRPGPATGLPTWSEQGDLQMVLNAHQGDFPRIVLAAGDSREALEFTMKAFNLADKYQTPVVLLVDKNICENEQSFPIFDVSGYKIDRGKLTADVIEDYKRYKLNTDGISMRTMPGSGNFFCANSDEHDEYGYSTEESELRSSMVEKRMTKLKTCEKQDMEEPQLFGPQNADVTIVSWGSNKGSIIQALKVLENVNYVHLTWLNPFPAKALVKLLSKSKYILNVECNYTGQMAKLIREHTGIEITDNLFKYDGRQILPEEIVAKISKIREAAHDKTI